jgi:inner membrane protein
MSEENSIQSLARLLNESILAKLVVIAIIILALLIPSAWIEGLITERSESQKHMVADISDKWSAAQTIQGPVLVVPYKKQVKEVDTAHKVTYREAIDYLYILPDYLTYKASVKTEIFHRGIIDATVYSSVVGVQGNFLPPDLSAMGLIPEQLLYDKARLVFNITDLKGLKTQPTVTIQNINFNAEPVYNDNTPFKNGLQVNFNLPKQGFTFKYTLQVNGADSLNFLHLGKTTDIEVKSDWNSPSFDGKFLPDKREISNSGFTAHWHLLNFNRPLPQQWIGDSNLLLRKAPEAQVEVKMHLPVDQYRKVTRTTKYSALIITLTFVALFFTELIRKQNIHLFNYILIGAAMVVYYTLLLSFSEHLGYNVAYLISSVATIGLVGIFTGSLLGNRPAAILFAAILSTFYGFIYILIQLEELSLLFGSISLFIIIALLMYFSRKINWEKA